MKTTEQVAIMVEKGIGPGVYKSSRVRAACYRHANKQAIGPTIITIEDTTVGVEFRDGSVYVTWLYSPDDGPHERKGWVEV